MIIQSSAFNDGDEIPPKYSYSGGNISPPLSFDEVPEESISLALICHDPDAPRPGGFTHWLIWNINPGTTEIKENSIPKSAVLGHTDWGDNDWGGPEPPNGTHHYNFTLYALDKVLDLPASSSRKELQEAMEPHIIETANLTGLFTAS